MLTISREQWTRLGTDSFDRRMIAIIRRSHPELAGEVADEQFSVAFAEQRARAVRHGLDDERSAAIYVYAAWLFGPRFDERIPSLAQVLGEPGLSAHAKAETLRDFTKAMFHVLAGGELPAAGGSPR